MKHEYPHTPPPRRLPHLKETPPPPTEGSAPSIKLALGKTIGGKPLGGKALGKKKGGFAFGRKVAGKNKPGTTKKHAVSGGIFCCSGHGKSLALRKQGF